MRHASSTTTRSRTVTIAAIGIGAAAALLAYFILATTGGSGPAPSPMPRAPAALQQLYVGPTGNDSGDGSQAAPLQTIQAALERATPGTVINLAPGEYREQVTTVREGSPDAPITIRGPEQGTDPSGRYQAVLRGQGRIVSIDHSYYTLEGFTVDGQQQLSGTALPTDLTAIAGFKDGVQPRVVDSKLIYIGAGDSATDITGVTIRNMFLSGAGSECVRLRNNAHGNTIADSVIQYCGMFAKDPKGKAPFRYHNGEGVYIGTSPKSDKQPMRGNDGSSTNVVTGNVIRTFGSECFDVKENAHDNVFENNDCSNNAEPLDNKGSNVELRGFNNVVRGNVISGSAGWNVKIQSDDPGKYDNSGNAVENNNLTGSAGAPVRIGTDASHGSFCGNVATTANPVDGESPGDITQPCPSGGSAPAVEGPR
ncbi:right-handed parallel beta-helix repeat-containing protein [Pseudonocardia sp. MH-G8]|uniref:DUF1565 domain-containing protein n=1 Tax=Pseudonocardia sp. MH-G8 TaxID=1854588 RepID=UPI000BA0B071|nr:right-handed parallel beta-helix repeat-containing protein [Pseudonocardia sp. MH-G8]OZM76383.1 hypothetical protein CFP66_41335 [Pseudonocardia sp. MH-G8]